LFSGAILVDPPFTAAQAKERKAPWDFAWTKEGWRAMLTQANAVSDLPNNRSCALIIKHTVNMTALINEVLDELHWLPAIQYLWIKQDMNIVGFNHPAPAYECISVSRPKGSPKLLMSGADPNPMHRHNLLIGNRLRQHLKAADGSVINPCQTPMYVSKCLVHHIGLGAGEYVYVPTMGTAADVVGSLAGGGGNVLAIEQDADQFAACESRLIGLETWLSNNPGKTIADFVALEGDGFFGIQPFMQHAIALEAEKKAEKEAAEANALEKAKIKQAKEEKKCTVCFEEFDPDQDPSEMQCHKCRLHVHPDKCGNLRYVSGHEEWICSRCEPDDDLRGMKRGQE